MRLHTPTPSASLAPRRPWRHAACRIAGAVVLATLLQPAQAGRPLVTEDAGVLGAGECELELYAGHQRLSPAGRLRSASAQASCGMGGGVQAALALERARERGTDEAGRADAGVLSAKARLLGEADGPALALVGAAGWGRSGHRAWRHEAVFIGLAGSSPLADGLTGHVNLGHLDHRGDRQRSTTWALALELAATPTLDLGAEAFGDDRERPWLGTGLRWAATPTLSLGASAAVQPGRGRARLFTAGLTMGF